MLNNIYNAIKTELNGIETAENTQWFNMQYENKGWVFQHGFFVEFPNQLDFEYISKQAAESPLRVRIHAYSKFVQTHEGIADSEVLAHETLALAAKTALKGFKPIDGTTRLKFAGWRHWHRLNNWMVTYIEFDAKYME